ncbi:ketopantoate reductase family protein [Pseudooceanicola sp. LIPI14-2-Ac024]|uniref:ketopantoate reductase family protein n=1 Tax=Pseudooceanicola sp. LIPI14-2-Ac024 TaxID=3344875 RepID=UPI0035D0FA4F
MTAADLPPLPEGPLDICIVGPGAIGGTIAARLAAAQGTGGLGRVSVVARGAHLAAIRDNGLRLRTPAGETCVAVNAVADPGELPPQDVVITALKGHQIPPMAAKLAAMMKPASRILPVVNGLPWWYPLPDGAGGVKGAEEVDPGGALWREIGPERAIGAIAYLGASVPEPGVISVEIEGYLDLGRLPGEPRADVERIAGILRGAGWTVRETEPFQDSLFSKLFSNCSLNSVCAISRASQASIANDPALRGFAAAIMEEVRALAEAEGATIRMTTEKRLHHAAHGPDHAPSTLQDLRKGNPMEIEPIFGATVALGRARGVPMPMLELATSILREVEKSRTA